MFLSSRRRRTPNVRGCIVCGYGSCLDDGSFGQLMKSNTPPSQEEANDISNHISHIEQCLQPSSPQVSSISQNSYSSTSRKRRASNSKPKQDEFQDYVSTDSYLEVMEHLTCCKSILSPIRELPPDLVVSIAAELRESRDSRFTHPTYINLDINRGIWPVSQVCRTWRNAILNCPFLWSALDIRLSEEFNIYIKAYPVILETALLRSRTHPLTFRFTTNRHNRSDPIRQAETKVLSLLLHASERWKDVVIDTIILRSNPWGWFSSHEGESTSCNLDNLTALTLHTGLRPNQLDPPLPLEFLPFFSSLTNLRALSIANTHAIPVQLVEPIHSNRLTYLNIRVTTPMSFASYLPFLQNAENLIELELQVTGHSHKALTPSTCICFPKLRLFTFRMTESGAVENLIGMRMPVLQQLHMSGMCFNTTFRDSIEASFEGVASIDQLVLQTGSYISCMESTFRLRSFRNITRLELVDNRDGGKPVLGLHAQSLEHYYSFFKSLTILSSYQQLEMLTTDSKVDPALPSLTELCLIIWHAYKNPEAFFDLLYKMVVSRADPHILDTYGISVLKSFQFQGLTTSGASGLVVDLDHLHLLFRYKPIEPPR